MTILHFVPDRKRVARYALLSAAVLATAIPCGAAAPSQVPPNVLDRSRPEYDAAGIPLGGFIFYPKLGLVSEYDDNIYATETQAVDDVIFHVRPNLRLATAWPDDQAELTAYGSINRYLDHDAENTNSYGISGSARFSIHDATALSGNIDFHHDALSRESVLSSAGAAHPVEFNQGSAHLEGSQGWGHLKLTAFADWLKLAYQNDVLRNGTSLFEKALDIETFSEGLRSDYAISPDTSLFVSGRMFSSSYPVKPPAVPLDRSSHGYELTGGLSLHVTDILSGDIGAGYLQANYPHIGSQNVNSFALHVALAWYPTLLTSVKLRADRTIEQAPLEISSGYLVTRYRLEVDHELRRNLILSLLADYSSGNFSGVDRRDNQWHAGLSASYLLSPAMRLKLSYTHETRDSQGADRGQNFQSNKVMLAFVLQE